MKMQKNPQDGDVENIKIVDRTTKLCYCLWESCWVNKREEKTPMVSKYEIFSSVVASLYHDIQRIERAEMAKYGLKGPHAQCLVTMARYPEGITAARLCEICERDKAAISRTVSELEEAGLLMRGTGKEIRYRVPLMLTAKGEKAAKTVNDLAVSAVEQAGVGLNDQQREVFYHVLDVISRNLHTISREGIQKKGGKANAS